MVNKVERFLKPRLHYAQFLVPYHFLVLGLPK
jgi:hypothetical protein